MSLIHICWAARRQLEGKRREGRAERKNFFLARHRSVSSLLSDSREIIIFISSSSSLARLYAPSARERAIGFTEKSQECEKMNDFSTWLHLRSSLDINLFVIHWVVRRNANIQFVKQWESSAACYPSIGSNYPRQRNMGTTIFFTTMLAGKQCTRYIGQFHLLTEAENWTKWVSSSVGERRKDEDIGAKRK